MKSLGEQLGTIIDRKFKTINREASPKVAEAIAERMKENTQSGKGFGNDRYDNIYEEKYAKRAKNGKRTPVTLRQSSRRIEGTKIQFLGAKKGNEISFLDGGNIFKYHHDGIDYAQVGLRVRSVFPKTAKSVPADIKEVAHKAGAEVLSGAK